MRKRIFKTFAWILGTLLLLLGLFIGFLFWKQDQIKAMVIDSLNENLNGEISVAQASISLRKFPMAAIELGQVLAKGSNDLNDTLFQVESLFLEFKMWDVFGDQIPLQALSLENGDLHLVQLGRVNNWSIFKSGESENGDFELSIAALHFVDIRFDYRKDNDLYVKAYATEASAKGQFSSNNWGLLLSIDGYADAVEMENVAYLSFPLHLAAEADLQGDEDILLQLSSLMIDKQSGFQAHYSSIGEGEFELSHPSLNLKEISALYKELSYPWPDQLDVNAIAQVKLKVLPKNNGDTRIELFAESPSLRVKYNDWPEQELSAKLEYYKQGNFDRIEIRELKEGDNSLQLVGTIRQIAKPNLNLDLAFSKRAEFWQSFLKRNFAIDKGLLSGQMKLQGQFNSWAEIFSERLNASNINGSLKIRDLDLGLPDGTNFKQVNGKLRFKNRSIFVDSLSLMRNKSDLHLMGELRDLWSYLFRNDGVLALRADLHSEDIILEDFMSESEEGADTSGILSWKDRLQFGLNISVKNFSFRNFQAKNLSGTVAINKERIRGDGIKLFADQGSYKGAFIIAQKQNDLDFTGSLEALKVEVHSVFKSFDNFSQQTLTADNLAGQLSVKTNITAPLSKDLRLDINGLKLQSEMTIEQGHLKNYEPMQALSRFAEVEELKDVSFQTLKNTISIENGIIQIPEMAIASNVINMDLSGTHSFENDINYLVKLRLADVLFAKNDRKVNNNEFEDHLTIAKRDDDHRIPISITGTVDQPEISINASALGDALEKDLKQQKDELKDIFKKEEPKKKQGTGMTFEWDDGKP